MSKEIERDIRGRLSLACGVVGGDRDGVPRYSTGHRGSGRGRDS